MRSKKRLVRVEKPHCQLAPMATLEQYAFAHCLSSAHEARGVCLWASVELAAHADRLGLTDQVSLLRWRLSDDPDFVEHWALKVTEDRVLDLTAVQVDGNPTPWRLLDSYPPHYGKPRQYPIPLVLPHARPGAEGGRVERRVIWRLHSALAKYEVSCAYRRGAVSEMAAAGLRLGVESMRLGLGYVLERAIDRLSHLLRRLK